LLFLISYNNIMSKERELEIIKKEYETALSDIICYGNKCGWRLGQILENPYLFLHLVLEFSSMFSD